MSKFPTVIFPGFQKCGTATIHRLLSQHPQLCLPKQKPQYFTSDRFSNAKDATTYTSSFLHCQSPQIIIDPSDSYIVNHYALRRLRDTLGDDLRFIISVRNPAKRIYSAYLHMRSPALIGEQREFDDIITGHEQNLDDLVEKEDELLNQAVRNGLVLVEDQKRKWGKHFLWNFRYVYNTLYAKHIEMLLEIFPKASIHLVVLERLIDETKVEIQNLYRFLGIDDASVDQPHLIHKNKSQSITLELNRPLIKLYWNIASYLRSGWSSLFIKRLLHEIEKRLLGTYISPHIEKNKYDHLIRLFSEEIKKLETITNQRIDIWQRDLS